jgi:hypothetical protein
VIAFPFCVSYTSYVIVALLLGLFVSAYISLTSIVLVDLIGLDSLTSRSEESFSKHTSKNSEV